jgi:hypothetical protein
MRLPLLVLAAETMSFMVRELSVCCLTLRFSEPGGSVMVALVAPRAPGG